ncbi:hypothetical protein BDZ88DRAFT_428054 [Geranomyces variabilis]|nr:hypothetical protein BDZ88DRAFT_428054 [Geranomyces variabilis]KAJ3134176.1 hypothetical protein HDU90_005273 [Geranomyces variabilis]
MPCQVVKVADVARPFITELKTKVATLPSPPLLLAFLANDDPAARKYAEWTAKTCADTGLRFKLVECPRTELEDRIVTANADADVHGIMVYYPVFGGTQDGYIQNTVSHRKDVEGLCHKYRYNMYHNVRFLDAEKTEKCIVPCTPLALVKILEHVGVYNRVLEEGDRLHGRTVTIVNRSEVVGRPLAALLANDGAKVYSVDVDGIMELHRGTGLKLRKHEVFETKITLREALAASDVVITGVPSPSYKIDTSQLKDGVVAVNFSTAKNFSDDITDKASIYVPSVGKVTVAMLERNLLRLHEYLVKNQGKD